MTRGSVGMMMILLTVLGTACANDSEVTPTTGDHGNTAYDLAGEPSCDACEIVFDEVALLGTARIRLPLSPMRRGSAAWSES